MSGRVWVVAVAGQSDPRSQHHAGEESEQKKGGGVILREGNEKNESGNGC